MQTNLPEFPTARNRRKPQQNLGQCAWSCMDIGDLGKKRWDGGRRVARLHMATGLIDWLSVSAVAPSPDLAASRSTTPIDVPRCRSAQPSTTKNWQVRAHLRARYIKFLCPRLLSTVSRLKSGLPREYPGRQTPCGVRIRTKDPSHPS